VSRAAPRDGAVVAEVLAAATPALGLSLDEACLARLTRYAGLVDKWRQVTNLTGARSPVAFAREHLVDSLSIVPHVDHGPLLDVGSGAGLPGVVLAIARPEIAVTLLEPRQRRARFLTQVKIELALDNVSVIAARIEALPATATYHVVVSRAFSALADYVALALPHRAPGARILAMKGRIDAADLARAESLAGPARVVPLHVPGFHDRHLVVFAGA